MTFCGRRSATTDGVPPGAKSDSVLVVSTPAPTSSSSPAGGGKIAVRIHAPPRRSVVFSLPSPSSYVPPAGMTGNSVHGSRLTSFPFVFVVAKTSPCVMLSPIVLDTVRASSPPESCAGPVHAVPRVERDETRRSTRRSMRFDGLMAMPPPPRRSSSVRRSGMTNERDTRIRRYLVIVVVVVVVVVVPS